MTEQDDARQLAEAMRQLLLFHDRLTSRMGPVLMLLFYKAFLGKEQPVIDPNVAWTNYIRTVEDYKDKRKAVADLIQKYTAEKV